MPDSPDRQARYDLSALSAYLAGRAWDEFADVDATIREARERLTIAEHRLAGGNGDLSSPTPGMQMMLDSMPDEAGEGDDVT